MTSASLSSSTSPSVPVGSTAAIGVSAVPSQYIKNLVPPTTIPKGQPSKDVASIAALIKASRELDTASKLANDPNRALAKFVQKELSFVQVAADILESNPADAKQRDAVSLLRLQYGGDIQGVLDFAEVLRDIMEQRAASKNIENAINSSDMARQGINALDTASVFGH